jgi:hypothetical protein
MVIPNGFGFFFSLMAALEDKEVKNSENDSPKHTEKSPPYIPIL